MCSLQSLSDLSLSLVGRFFSASSLRTRESALAFSLGRTSRVSSSGRGPGSGLAARRHSRVRTCRQVRDRPCRSLWCSLGPEAPWLAPVGCTSLAKCVESWSCCC